MVNLKKQINNLYIDIFMDISNYNNFIKSDTRTYSNYDDYIDNYYISPYYKLLDSETKFRFFIKKHWFNYRIEVRLNPGIDHSRYTERFNIYRDTLHLKNKSPIKNKLIDIINFTDYNILMKKVANNPLFARKMKMEKIMRKV